jgi:hypothetical protein
MFGFVEGVIRWNVRVTGYMMTPSLTGTHRCGWPLKPVVAQ